MQVSVEKLEGLERRVNIQVPASRVDDEVRSRLSQLARRVKLDGFRPGKVPLKVVQRMYGPQVRQEVLGEVLEQSFREAVSQENLRPAGGPKIEPKSLEAGSDLEYAAVFEVFPEFEVKGIDAIVLERPVAEVAESDIDAMVENLRKQRTDWEVADRGATDGDRVTLDFVGTLDGEAFDGGKGENATVILGSGRMVADFEAGLVGMTAGQTKTIDVSFPEDYPAENLAGKTAQFALSVHKVEVPRLPEVDEAFVQQFGISDGAIDSLRTALRENMERELGQTIKARMKEQVMDQLLGANEVSLPQSMVEDEIEQLAKQMRLPEDKATPELKAQLFAEQAKRRVALGLIVSRLVVQESLKPEPARIQAQLDSMAANYEDPSEVIRWYRQNPQAMESVSAAALEDQVVDWVVEKAQVTDKPVSFDDVMKGGRR